MENLTTKEAEARTIEKQTRARGALEAIVSTVAAEDPDFQRFLRDFQIAYPLSGK